MKSMRLFLEQTLYSTKHNHYKCKIPFKIDVEQFLSHVQNSRPPFLSFIPFIPWSPSVLSPTLLSHSFHSSVLSPFLSPFHLLFALFVTFSLPLISRYSLHIYYTSSLLISSFPSFVSHLLSPPIQNTLLQRTMEK